MKSIIIFVISFLFSLHHTLAQRSISGIVQDSITSEKLIGATIFNTENNLTAFTNNYGFFSIQVSEKKVTNLNISYVGYRSVEFKVNLGKDSLVFIGLSNDNMLNEVEVRSETILKKAPGMLSLNAQKIKQLPALLGEPDILKSLSLTPGVSTGTEGTTGIFVRGGTPDQNLIILDEVPLYNVNHLAGFISVFNTNALKKVDFYKSYIPAQYGGRASSVIDIAMKDGAINKTQGEVTLGLINQNASIEGPVFNKKGSYMIAGRYSNLAFTKLFASNPNRTPQGQSFEYSFYDINGKLNVNLNKKNQMQFSFYKGKDDFIFNTWNSTASTPNSFENLADWGNTAVSLKHTKIIGDKIFVRSSVSYTNYFNNQTIKDTDYDAANKEVLISRDQESIASLNDIIGKIRLEYFPGNKLSITSGIDYTLHSILPIRFKTNLVKLELENTNLNTRLNGSESGIYTDLKLSVIPKLDFLAGLRYTTYRMDNTPFSYFEPRFGLNYFIGSNTSINLHYVQNNQFVHLLTNNSLGFSNDLWVPATGIVPPVNAKSIGIGVRQVFNNQAYDVSFEAYSKSLSNLIDYPEGTNFTSFLKESWDQVVEKNGIGRSFGIELALNKNKGKLTGWVSYTLSKSDRKFSNINRANWFPFKYDRRNMLSVVANYKLNYKWSFNGTFVYQNGSAVTLPEAAYFQNTKSNVPVFIYSGRNNSRMPDYHRLDLGVSKRIITRAHREALLSFGLYNSYNRRNANYLDLINKPSNSFESQVIEVRKYSIFPILPFVSYTLKF